MTSPAVHHLWIMYASLALAAALLGAVALAFAARFIRRLLEWDARRRYLRWDRRRRRPVDITEHVARRAPPHDEEWRPDGEPRRLRRVG